MPYSAGIPNETLSGSNTSVYSATFGMDYRDNLMRDSETLTPEFLIGNGTAYTRIESLISTI